MNLIPLGPEVSEGSSCDLIQPMAKRRIPAPESLGPAQLESEILELLSELPDPRQEGKRHYRLDEILFLVIAGVLSGFNDITGIAVFGREKLDWLRGFMPYENGTPSHDTIGRVLGLLCPDALEMMFSDWMSDVDRRPGVIAVDGKTLRGAKQRGAKSSLIHMVSAFASATGMVIGQLKTDEKSNEITAIPRLIEALDIAGGTVTIDAGGCHAAIIDAILERGADFVIGVKRNQQTLLDDCDVAFHDADLAKLNLDEYTTQERGHGRGERRVCQVLPAATRLTASDKWHGIKTLIRITSERFVDGAPSENIRFYVSSRELTAKQALNLVRAHWGIENRVHWCLDTQFDEDHNRIYARHAAENLVVVRHLVLNLLRGASFISGGIKARRMQCAISDSARSRVLAGG